ncbi:MAG: polymerase [Hyphobacterium sp.]|nr:MAG: polymerase [Hyphobacterium sp.]
MFFSAMAAASGGLSLPPFVALGGIIAIPWRQILDFRENPPWEAVLFLLFFAWVMVSWTWSPYEKPDQAIKLLVGIPLYASFAFAISKLRGKWQSRVEAAFVFMAFAASIYLFAEFVINGDATLAYKLAVENAVANDQHTLNQVNRSLGHGALLSILFAGPAAALAWREGGPLIGLLLITITGIMSLGFGLEVNSVAFLGGLFAATCAYFWPRGALSATFGAISGAFVVVPLTLPSVAGALPASVRAALPESWDIRLEIWQFTGERLAENPWLGWGLDAGRVIDAEAEIRGTVQSLLPLHPHNAPLQVWLETGAFGAVLVMFAIVLLGGRIAGAPRLSRLQAAAISWVAVTYFTFIFFSYGVWQEWHMAALAVAVAGTTFLSAKSPAR